MAGGARGTRRAPGARAEEDPEEDPEEVRRWFRGGRRTGAIHRQGREAQGGDGRDPRRDRLSARGERRGVRQVLRPKGRGMRDESRSPVAPGGPIGANPSFFDLVARSRPETLSRSTTPGDLPGVPHGTTVLGMKFAAGVVFAGDRR